MLPGAALITKTTLGALMIKKALALPGLPFRSILIIILREQSSRRHQHGIQRIH